jgi:hypothetical protein
MYIFGDKSGHGHLISGKINCLFTPAMSNIGFIAFKAFTNNEIIMESLPRLKIKICQANLGMDAGIYTVFKQT